MQCPSCKAELRAATGFCPHCGARVSDKPSTYATSNMQGDTGSGLAPAYPEEDGTLRLPDSWIIPKRYVSRLAAGTKPEEIISELIRHNLKMRRVLEGILKMFGPKSRSEVANALKGYLQSHCMACGAETRVFEAGAIPLCVDCSEKD